MPAQNNQSAAPAPPGPTPAAFRFSPPSVVAEQRRRSHRLLLLVVRLLFLVLLVTVSLLTVASQVANPREFEFTTVIGLFIGATAIGIIVLVVFKISRHS